MELLYEILQPVNSPLPKDILISQTYSILISDRSDDEIQGELYELMGELLFEVGELLYAVRGDLQSVYLEQIQNLQSNAVIEQSKEQVSCVIPQISESIQPASQAAVQFNSGIFDAVFIPQPIDDRKKLSVIQEIPLAHLPHYLQQVFPSEMISFNKMQSQVFSAAFDNSMNLLVSAPTSAGKTNVALLCICKMIHQFVLRNVDQILLNVKPDVIELDGTIISAIDDVQEQISKLRLESTNFDINNKNLKHIFKKSDFLCVYLTPLKALASEITLKFTDALLNLGLNVLMCTGDESPPQQLIDAANVLILTPEKYDVMTRKISLDDKLYLRQQLLIIDEIHLLGVKSRGPVIEQIVCRTKQFIEFSQIPLRLVGISATIPNYQDIARFMNVPRTGLFVFGQEYRPVPMTQFIVGVKELSKLKDTDILSNQKMTSQQKLAIQSNSHCFEVISSLQYSEKEIVDMKSTRTQANKVRNESSKKTDQKQFKQIRDEDVLDNIAVNICFEHFNIDHPTLLFVHSRKKTVLLAQTIAAKIRPQDYDKRVISQARDCENGALSICMMVGIGFHHAGMEKKFRTIVEDQFRKGNLTIVVCTATLAWGVNLPAQTVIIRGTDIMTDEGLIDLDILDVKQIFGRAGRPQFTDTGELGRGIILTKQEKIHHYMNLVNGNQLIESQLGAKLPDILNAEIVLGTISSFNQAFDYMKQTYFYIRKGLNQSVILDALLKLQQSKLLHCDQIISVQDVSDNDNLLLTTTELGRICSHFYIDFNTLTQFLDVIKKSAVGNVISHSELLQYISMVPQFQNIKIQQEEKDELHQITGSFLDNVSDQVEILKDKRATASQISQFVNRGIKNMSNNICHIKILSQDDEKDFKINALIQAYICRYEFKNQSCKNDQKVILQSLPRIASAFFECLLTFRRLEEALKMNDILNSIMYQIPFDIASPFIPLIFYPVGTVQQQSQRKKDYSVVLTSEERRNVSNIIQTSTVDNFQKAFSGRFQGYEEFMNLSFDEIYDKLGKYQTDCIISCRKFIPQLYFDVFASPVSQKVIRVSFYGTPNFLWNKQFHGYEQNILVVFARSDNGYIIHQKIININEETQKKPVNLTFLIRASEWQKMKIGAQVTKYSSYLKSLDLGLDESTQSQDNGTPQMKVVVLPMLWTGSKSIVQTKQIELKIAHQEQIQLQFNENNSKVTSFKSSQSYYTPLVICRPLPVKSIHWLEAEKLFQFKYFNPLQSSMFHTLYYKDSNIFIGAPTSCGKTVCAELATLRCIQNGLKTVYIAPMKALTRERFIDWQNRFKLVSVKVIELTGDSLPNQNSLNSASIIITTPEKFDVMTRHMNQKQFLQSIGLIIMDEVHLIGTARGYILESVVARFKQMKIRLIGMSTASSNAKDVANWLNVQDNCIFNFDPNARPVRLDVHIQGYIGDHYCPRMELMNKPIYQAIKNYSPDLPVLIFCSSRRQAHRTGYALIQQAMQDANPPKNFWKQADDKYIDKLLDKDAINCLRFGVGVHHAAMCETDRNHVQALFTSSKIGVLVATGTLAWGVNVPAFMTIIKGCEYYNKNTDKYDEFDITEINQMMGRAGRPQFIQQRYLNWIQEYFGSEVQQFLVKKGVFENMYRFDSKKIQKYLRNGDDRQVTDLLQQLETKDRITPQAVSLIMCKQDMKEFYKSFINEPLPFESSLLSNKFGNSLQSALLNSQISSNSPLLDVLNGEISSRGMMTRQDIRLWLQNTFFFLRARKNPQLYGIDLFKIASYIETSDDDFSSFQNEFALYSNGCLINQQQKSVLIDFFTIMEIYQIVELKLKELIQLDLVIPQELPLDASFEDRNQQTFYITKVGDIASDYYMQAQSLRTFDSYCTGQLPLLETYASLPEFSQVPVRCTENIEMQQIYQDKLVKYQLSYNIYNSPVAKTHLLYQAQFSKSLGKLQLPNSDYYLDMLAVLDNALRFCMASLDYVVTRFSNYAKAVEIIRFAQSVVQGQYPEDDDRLQLKFVRRNLFLLKQLDGMKLIKTKQIVAQIKQKNKQLLSILPEIEKVDHFPHTKVSVFGKFAQEKESKFVDIEVVISNLNPSCQKVISEFYQKLKPLTFYLIIQDPIEHFQRISFLPNQSSYSFRIKQSQKLKLFFDCDGYRGFDFEANVRLDKVAGSIPIQLI